MICVVIKGPSYNDAQRQITQALTFADLVELRLDCFTTVDAYALKALRKQFSVPMIFTLRSTMQGGSYRGSEDERLADISRLLEVQPEYLDVEHHVPPRFIEEICAKAPQIKLILSYHNFESTPNDLEGIYQEMQKIPASYYKIAVTAKNSVDALKLLSWAKNAKGNLIPISMGPHGHPSRILAPITYASLEQGAESAPGQLSAATLVDQYHHKSINGDTALYGLIGDPVDLSISDVTHNSLMHACDFNARYVKIQVSLDELRDFLQLAKKLPFHGLSVTMPLKEPILPLLDALNPEAQRIGAVNTLVLDKGKFIGFNTDGMGALNAIEQEGKVSGQHIVIVGAGGAAKAIAYEAVKRKARVTIVNRDVNKAMHVATSVQCKAAGLDHMAELAANGYDVLINCTPAALPIDAEYILRTAIVMDIKTKPKDTPFLTHAKQKGCRIVYGYKMFIEQALGQFHLWFNDSLDIQKSRDILLFEANKII